MSTMQDLLSDILNLSIIIQLGFWIMVGSTEKLDAAQHWVEAKVQRYVGQTVQEIKDELLPDEVESKAKFVNIARAMLEVSGNKFVLPGDVKTVLKTVRVMGNGQPAENMSFMMVNFQEWCDSAEWQSCSLYKYFDKNALLFFVFQQYTGGKRVPDDEMVFKGVKIEYIDSYDLNHGIKQIWDEVRRLILDNELEVTPFTQKNGKVIMRNNLPSGSFNGIAHLRPGGANGMDRVTLPNGVEIARQRFWLNAEYVSELIQDVL